MDGTEKNMISENFDIIYKRFRIEIYRHIFRILGRRDSSLSAADYFSVETIYLLGNPTITEFARTLCISAPNATYRVKSLVEKGYVEKKETEKKSAYRLCVTEKFMRYYHEDMGYGNFVFERLASKMTEEELKEVDEIFEKFIRETEEKGEREC